MCSPAAGGVGKWIGGRPARRLIARRCSTPPTPGRERSSSEWWRVNGVWVGASSVAVAAMAGTTASRLVQYGILGLLVGIALGSTPCTTWSRQSRGRPESRLPVMLGSVIPFPVHVRAFAAWSNVFVVAIVFIFAVDGAMLAAAFGHAPDEPVLFIVIGVAMALFFGVPITVGARVLAFTLTDSRPCRRHRTCCCRGLQSTAAGGSGR